MTLADELERAKQQQQVANWDAAERRVAEELGLDLKPKSELPPDLRIRLDSFNRWAQARGCRRLPAKPWVVARFLSEQAGLGVPWPSLAQVLAALAAAHDRHFLADPTSSTLVRQTIEQIAPPIEAPRSWPREDKANFALLPSEIREVITRRENQRDKELRRAQNAAAEAKRQASGADKLAQTNNEDTGNDQATQRH